MYICMYIYNFCFFTELCITTKFHMSDNKPRIIQLENSGRYKSAINSNNKERGKLRFICSNCFH